MSVLTALRELFSQYPEAMKSSPVALGRMLHVVQFLSYRPEVCAVEETLEALRIEGEVAA